MKNKTKCEEDNTLTIKNVHTGRQEHPNQLEMFENEGHTSHRADDDGQN